MGDVVAMKPRENPNRQGRRMAILFLMGAWGMMFFTVLFIFAVVRATAKAWPPAGTPPLPTAQSGVALLLCAVTAALAWAAHRAIAQGKVNALRAWAFLALAGSFAALAAQVLAVRPLRAARPESEFGILVLTALAFHVVTLGMGAGGLAVMAYRSARGRYTAAAHAGPTSWSLYWAFIAGCWAVLYPVLFFV